MKSWYRFWWPNRYGSLNLAELYGRAARPSFAPSTSWNIGDCDSHLLTLWAECCPSRWFLWVYESTSRSCVPCIPYKKHPSSLTQAGLDFPIFGLLEHSSVNWRIYHFLSLHLYITNNDSKDMHTPLAANITENQGSPTCSASQVFLRSSYDSTAHSQNGIA